MEDQPVQDVYFIGIALPSDLDVQIAELKWKLHETNEASLKPIVPHVTLLNPPSLQGVMPSELVPKVREVAARYLPMTISLERVAMFGSQVCYIAAESLDLYSLQSQLVKLLPPEAQKIQNKYPYRPHMTLVQVYDPEVIDIDKVQEIVSSSLTLPLQFTIDSVTCFKRILPREYRPETI